MTMNDLLELALACGFDRAGELNVPALTFDPAVREMCAADRCHLYGRSWTCPPYCGTLEEIAARARRYRRGILLQCTGQMEDDFDGEAIMDTQRRQQESFLRLTRQVRRHWPDCLPMSSGGCPFCPSCTCPDQPCRFPDRAVPSMEAYGLLVSRECENSGMKYYYGPRTITFTACILID